ncbi:MULTISPECIES: DNA polymerase [unclassified Pseudomonas]|uniref:DNA polymerase n=1 Tax=unclassified Pseudomonas TaxID=196821 RepID=UPI000C88D73A|nr:MULTISPECIES: DNA polymerase [unclassified Pseudomonas]PMX14142.1 DNA polymerase [Pseudomonas sp. MPBC4-3]PMX46242.1 DNA polymerase [Pseudomonas sp. FW301-21B01]PMY07047.1 DNA polymerase [Pseudomonas sp. MPR-R5A]PNA67901.1 DNA polymerase [Pseudomonas sp. MPR-R5B]
MLISDIETNGFLSNVSKFHCGVSQDYFTGELFEYGPDNLKEYIAQLEAEAAKPDGLVVFHNGIKYDIPVLDKLKRLYFGKRLNIPRKRVMDTLVLSRLIHSNIRDTDAGYVRTGKLPGKRMGSHALEAWGYRLGEMKGEYTDDFKAACALAGIPYVSGAEWAEWSPEMQAYCVQDVAVTTKLTTKLMSDPYYFPSGLAPNGEHWMQSIRAVHLEHDAAWSLAQMERNGFPFDPEAAERLYAELAGKRSDLLVKLIQTFGSWYAPKGGTELFRHPVTGKPIENWSDGRPMPRVKYPKVGGVYLKGGTKKDKRETFEGAPYTPIEFITFNPASGAHLIKVLKDAGWEPTEFTKTGAPKVDDETLEGVTVDDPAAQACIALVRDYLMIQKRIGMLAEGDNAWMRLVSPEGFMHGSINPNGAVTGRATHSYPNMGQIPSASSPYGPECRSLFGAVFARKKVPGWENCTQVGVDASGLELRCLGHFGAPFDKGEYADTVLNGDIHWVNGRAAGIIKFEIRDKHNDEHERVRGIAKTFIYAFLYGAGDAKVGGFIGGGKKEGKALKKSFLENTPAITGLREALEDSLITSQTYNNITKKWDVKWKRRWIKGLDGRKIHVRSPHSALNSLLQSAGALICKAWVVETERLLMEEHGYVHGWDGDFAFMAWVHDELQIAARTPEIAEVVMAAAQQAIRNVGESFNFRCRLDTDGKTGPTWRECH